MPWFFDSLKRKDTPVTDTNIPVNGLDPDTVPTNALTEEEVRKQALAAGSRMQAVQLMGMNRHQRRAIGRINGGLRIPGTTAPHRVPGKR